MEGGISDSGKPYLQDGSDVTLGNYTGFARASDKEGNLYLCFSEYWTGSLPSRYIGVALKVEGPKGDEEEDFGDDSLLVSLYNQLDNAERGWEEHNSELTRSLGEITYFKDLIADRINELREENNEP